MCCGWSNIVRYLTARSQEDVIRVGHQSAKQNPNRHQETNALDRSLFM